MSSYLNAKNGSPQVFRKFIIESLAECNEKQKSEARSQCYLNIGSDVVKIEPPKEGTPFQVNLFYQRLIKMRAVNRKSFDRLSPVTHLALSAYERAQRVAGESEAVRPEV